MQFRNPSITLLFVAVACTSSPRHSSPTVASVLDSLVPGPRIGARAEPIARELHLPFAPYVGYADSGFRNAAGVHGVVLRVDETLNSESHQPSRWARIANIGIGFDSRAGANAAKQLVTRHLGPPLCYIASDEQRRAALYFWPNQMPDGVLLTVPVKPYQPPFMVFGATEPRMNRSALGECDAA